VHIIIVIKEHNPTSVSDCLEARCTIILSFPRTLTNKNTHTHTHKNIHYAFWAVSGQKTKRKAYTHTHTIEVSSRNKIFAPPTSDSAPPTFCPISRIHFHYLRTFACYSSASWNYRAPLSDLSTLRVSNTHRSRTRILPID